MSAFPMSYALQVLHYVAPIAIGACFVATQCLTLCRHTRSWHPGRQSHCYGVVVLLAVLLLLLSAQLIHVDEQPPDVTFYTLSLVVVYFFMAILLLDLRTPLWHPCLVAWVLGLIFELLSAAMQGGFWLRSFNGILQIARTSTLVVLCIYGEFCRRDHYITSDTDLERQPLLFRENAESDSEVDALRRRSVEEPRGWFEKLKTVTVFAPILWPSGNRHCQVCLGAVAVFTVAERLLNVLLPRQLGIVVDEVAAHYGGGVVPWPSVGIYFLFLWLESQAGLDFARSFATLPLEQFAYKQIAATALEHVMTLDMEFHSNKDSSEIIRAIDQGQTLAHLVEFLGFECGPLALDLIVACVYIYALFDEYGTLITIFVGVVCVWVSTKTTLWSVKRRRRYNKTWRAMYKTQTAAIDNWQAVLQFVGAAYESGRYRNNIDHCHRTERHYFWSFYIGEAIHGTIILIGTLAALSWSFERVARGEVPLGRLVTLIFYLNAIGRHLKSVSKSIRKAAQMLTDAERLAQIMNTTSTVVENSGAAPLAVSAGLVEFDDVYFAYSTKTLTLKRITFDAKPGHTVALVGPSGSGKSTITKLLGRFYDVEAGEIRIDGQDISTVSIGSLRGIIGWVPQEPVLFNMSILDNIKYGRPNATEAEVESACRAAAIYFKIQTLPLKYHSVIGERGVKLSGGEKQRLAIARLLLNDAKIVVLDEATSAMDTETEQFIQECLQSRLLGRTVFIIAHRLSTIQHANTILVVDNGEIVERGTHDELLEAGSKYATLWSAQTHAASKDC